MRVLIVEDEPHVLDGLTTVIRWALLGFDEVDTACDGQEGWEKYLQQPPDLLLTDVYMPKLDGIALIRRIREHGGDVQAVILSGYSEFAYAQQAIELGVTRYMMKPAFHLEIEKEIGDIVREIEASRQRLHRIEEMREQLERHLPVMREHWVHKLATEGIGREAIDGRLPEFYGLDDSIVRHAAVVAVKLHRPKAKARAEKDWQLYQFACMNIAEEIAGELGRGCVLRCADDVLPVLFFGDDPVELLSRASAAADAFIRSIVEYLLMEVSVGIGRPYADTRQYPLSYKEAREMARLSELEGHNLVLYAGDAGAAVPDYPQYPLERTGLLVEALLRGDREQMDSIWKGMEKQLSSGHNAPLSQLQTMCAGILSQLLMQLPDKAPFLAEDIRLFERLQELQQLRQPDELYGWMREQLERLRLLIADRASDRDSQSYVEFVKAYVAEHYREPVSFAELARMLHLSRNYLSNLFTRRTGSSFISYLTAYRIERAKALLAANKYKAYEVAEMVGYQDPGYFSRMFKQMTDCSPTEFMATALHDTAERDPQ